MLSNRITRFRSNEKLAQVALNIFNYRWTCLLHNHGVLVMNGSLCDTKHVVYTVGFCAKIQSFSGLIGNPETVPDPELSELGNRHRSQLQK